MECQICFQSAPELFSIAKCQHRFCEKCCCQHINEKSSRFVQVLCPDPSCKKPFDKNGFLFKKLPPEVLHRLQKYEQFQNLQKNPQIRPCSQPNCQGTINMAQSKKTCNRCGTAFCPKCMKPFHEGQCILDEHDRTMIGLNNQKCPQCGIWVQKKQGCDYIDCKCGTAFCYRCGAKFSEDPCRKQRLWDQEIEVRKAMAQIKFTLPSEVSGKILKVITMPLRVLLFLFVSIFFSIIYLMVLLSALVFFIVISPLIILAIGCHSEGGQKCLVILFLPLLTALLIMILLVMFFGYPFFRNFYHHGLYDGLQWMNNSATICYLRACTCIFA